MTYNPIKASPGETLNVPVPKLEGVVVLVTGSLSLIFDAAVNGYANSHIVNKVARVLVDRLTEKFAGEIA